VRRSCLTLAFALALLPAKGLAQNQSTALARDCDRLAASPHDKSRPPGISGVELFVVDVDAARPVCQRALDADPENPRLLFEMGRVLQIEKDYDKARFAYERAISLGYSLAEMNLSEFYENGLGGLAKNDGQAVRAYQHFADQGLVVGQFDLGRMYQEGRGGLPRDELEAERLYRAAAEKGYAPAQSALGTFYETGGGGLQKNEEEAVRLYRLAADQSFAYGEINLARMYGAGRGGLVKNEAEASRLYKLAADRLKAQPPPSGPTPR